jgi:hypothetical protein
MLRQIFPRFVAQFAPGNRVRLTVGFAQMLVRQNFSLPVVVVLGTPLQPEDVVRAVRISGDTQAVFVAGKCHCTKIGTSSNLEADH